MMYIIFFKYSPRLIFRRSDFNNMTSTNIFLYGIIIIGQTKVSLQFCQSERSPKAVICMSLLRKKCMSVYIVI